MAANITVPKINLRELSSQVKGLVLRESTEDDFTGVPYSDPDAVGANPVATLYPDGTIIGSTDNGEYIKYADGTLICTQARLINLGDIETVTFAAKWIASGNFLPSSFVTPPSGFISMAQDSFNSVANRVCAQCQINMSASEAIPYVINITGITNTAINRTYIITSQGRWK